METKTEWETRTELDFGFVEEGGALRNPLENTGEFYLLPLQTLWEQTKIWQKKKKKGEIKLVSEEEKCFTLNEKQIFEQMEKLLCCLSYCAELPQIYKHSTKRLIWMLPFNHLLKYTVEEKDIQEGKRWRQKEGGKRRGSEIERKIWDNVCLVCTQALWKEINRFILETHIKYGVSFLRPCFHYACTYGISVFTFVYLVI